MPFIPHTPEDTQAMLAACGVDSTEALFDEIPAHLRVRELDGVPPQLSEMQITRLMNQRATQDGMPLNFVGAGAYEHHIPAAVWQIATRGEFYSAYTPYQAEASQGTLQLIYEYQTMMASLMGLEVSNASLYDGASGLAEAVLMAGRANRKSKSLKVLLPESLHPYYRECVQAICALQGFELVSLPLRADTGTTDHAALEAHAGSDICAVVIPQPNLFGQLEDVDALTDWAAAQGALSIAVVNPTLAAVLKPPGAWGEAGVDIACGDGQPLGAPLSSGGPYYGFLCCKQKHVRQMPGRIVGRTVDLDGKPGYTLTLQAREQHIRRAKATSNICTNQGLVVTASTIYMSLLGPQGLANVATSCLERTRKLAQALCAIDGVERVYSGAYGHELALRLPRPAQPVLEALSTRNIIGGFAPGRHYADMDDVLIVCATETKTDEDIAAYAAALKEVLA